MAPRTTERPTARPSTGQDTRRPWWALVSGVVGVLAILAMAGIWYLGRPASREVAPAPPDAAADAAAPEPDDRAARPEPDDQAARPQEPRPAEEPEAPEDAAPNVVPDDELPAVIEDGRHATYPHAVDVAGRTITVDVIQFLTGQQAIDAYHAQFPDDPLGPPNDYWIVNANPRLRTLPVAPDVEVRLVRLAEDADADLDPGTWEELPAYLASSRPPDGDRLSWNPYWIVVTDGVVTAIEEQYLP